MGDSRSHYLTVRKWQPDFKADKATAIKTAVWMRFPFLPYEYYDEESLFEIAKELGKPLKVDINTIEGIRASYARVCVELDLSQPLEVSVAIRNEDYLIEYEHIHLICFDCGRVGHRKESCNSKIGPINHTAGENPTVASPEPSAAKAVSFNGNPVPEKAEEIGYGEWMVVNRRKTKKNGPIGNGPQGPKRVQTQNGKGPAQNVSMHSTSKFGPTIQAQGESQRPSLSPTRKFVDNINKCKLMDLGYMGAKYTWTNGRLGLANVQKRLDRALSNEEWRSLFPEGNFKLNTDGCWYDLNGIGGLFRNHLGDWIIGYHGKRSFNSSLEAELWSIYKGLEIILERKLENVKIESDSLVAVNLVTEGSPGNHLQSVLINEAHFLLAQTNTMIGHIPRSANQSADHLARLGAEHTEDFMFVMDMPIEMREFVIRDSLNIRQVLD